MDKLIRLLERADHPGTPTAEKAVCVGQALKVARQLSKAPLVPHSLRKQTLWRTERDGGCYAWFDACRVSIEPVDHFGRRMFQLRIGEQLLDGLFANLSQAKARAEKEVKE